MPKADKTPTIESVCTCGKTPCAEKISPISIDIDGKGAKDICPVAFCYVEVNKIKDGRFNGAAMAPIQCRCGLLFLCVAGHPCPECRAPATYGTLVPPRS